VWCCVETRESGDEKKERELVRKKEREDRRDGGREE
jgi:hypothetical protein